MMNPTVPSNVPRPSQLPSNGAPSTSMPLPSNGAGLVRVKTEPGYESQGFQHNLPPNYSNNIAPNRAAQHLHQKFGAGANSQINQLHAQAAMNSPGGQLHGGVGNPQMPQQFTAQQREQAAEYHKRQQNIVYQNMHQQQQRPLANSGQTDGADDWDAYVTQRRLAASQNPKENREADLTIKQHVEQMNRSMEGGGLMMPLSEQSRQPQVKRRRVVNRAESSAGTSANVIAAESSDLQDFPKPLTQVDGAEDDDDDDGETKVGIKDELFDDDDEDAINSALDDSDDNAIEEEQEEGRPSQVMLCTYDKVQRVKNKWKCTLRDGVLNTGGKEYVFTKANGEFEW